MGFQGNFGFFVFFGVEPPLSRTFLDVGEMGQAVYCT